MTLSHPDKDLAVHLLETARNCELIIANNRFSFKLIDQPLLQNISHIMAYCHDVGKATKYFQEYLLSQGTKITGPKNHSFISAIYAKEFLGLFLQNCTIDEFYKSLLKVFVFTAIKRHHGQLRNIEDEIIENQKQKQIDDLIKQVKSINSSEYERIMKPLFEFTGVKLELAKFVGIISGKNYLSDLKDFYINHFLMNECPTTQKENIELFFLHNLLYSALLLSDKTDVIIGEKINRNSIELDSLTEYRVKKGFENPKEEIDILKNEAFSSAMSNIEKIFNPENHFYSITLPTGLGKTLTSFGVALTIKKLLKGQNSRIIITIPFTSIIDQNFEVYKEALNNADSSIILKHHHLADPVYKRDEDVLDYDKSSFLIETWQSEVVVTTFVQLMEAIFTTDKSKIMKLGNLANSIIIMDEIQTIDFEYWQLINKAFKILADTFNCYFILMTATQPLIFMPEKEITEIIPDYKKYYKFFNRTRIINKSIDDTPLDSFIDEVADYISENPKKDILIILNTKNICLDCFNKLIEYDDDSHDLFYLSTYKTPFERKNIISKIKDKNRTKPQIIVTTQLIEAGVDISVDTIFRELAPIDAIIQTAGRANRYTEKDTICDVFIYRIRENELKSRMVYGSILMNKTENVLKNYDIIEENNYLDMIEKYFIEIKRQANNITSTELEQIQKWKFKEISKFKYISERRSESIFVMLNENAKRVWEKYLEIRANKEIPNYKRKQLFAEIKNTFYEYVINVPVPFGKTGISFDSVPEEYFYLWKYYEPNNNYSYDPEDEKLNTGYKSIELLIF